MFSDEKSEEPKDKPVEDAAEPETSNKEEDTITEDSIENIFESPESVGNEDKDKNRGSNGSSTNGDGTSPNNFSSIARALKEDGPLSSVNDEFFDNIKDAQGFSDAIEEEVKNRLEESQKRVLDALNDGVEADDIRQYERTIKYLDSLNEDAITDESDEGAQLRKALIYQDLINKGYSKEKATKMLDKSISDGLDIEDAKDALEANKTYYKKAYKSLRDEAKSKAEAQREEIRKQDESLKKSIMKDNEIVKGIGSLDEKTRTKVYDSISKPIYKDPDTGKFYSAVQKYEKDNPVEFRKIMGLVYALTDGYKSFDNLVKSKVNSETKKSVSALERVINSTPRNNDGSYRLVNGANNDDNSFYDGIVALDI